MSNMQPSELSASQAGTLGGKSRRLSPRSRALGLAALTLLALIVAACSPASPEPPPPPVDIDGQAIFRHDTFGDETFWTDTLRLNETIEAAVTPLVAASVGLKIDAAALPAAVVEGVLAGNIPLDDTQTTLALLQLDAVVGVKGEVSQGDDGRLHLDRVGITCALCHSTVSRTLDLPVAGSGGVNLRGIVGLRLDGWANRDLMPGTIVSLAPALAGTELAAEYGSWAGEFGAGFYDPRLNVNVDPGTNTALGADVDANLAAYKAAGGNPVVIPAAFGLDGIDRAIFTGDGDAEHEVAGPVAYWNRYVGVVQMHGHGTFHDPRLIINGEPLSVDFMGTGEDLITSKLPALQAYQYSIAAPTVADYPVEAAARGVFVDQAAADRGEVLFNGQAGCVACHSGTLFTDANETLHDGTAAMSDVYLDFSTTKQWRATPLGGIWTHPPYFHDGSGAFDAESNLCLDGSDIGALATADTVTRDLACVVYRYNAEANPELAAPGLTAPQISDLVEFLKSI